MSWIDKLEPASFRNVPFKVKSTTTGVGRRNVQHEYPFKEGAGTNEDLGAASDDFVVVGHVIQHPDNDFDYFAERDALTAALKEPGVGTLVHPFYGRKQVALQGKAQIQENFTDGGMATFTMTFVESVDPSAPLAIISPPDEVGAGVLDILENVQDAVEDGLDLVGPDFLEDTIVGDIETGIDMVRDTVKSVQSTSVGVISGALSTLASIRDGVEGLVDSPSELMNAVRNTLDVYGNLIPFSTKNIAANPTDATTLADAVTVSDGGTSMTKAAVNMADFGKSPDDNTKSVHGGTLEPIQTTTPTRTQENDNRQLVVEFYQVGGLAFAVQAAANSTYGSQEDAAATMTLIMERIEEVLINIGDGSQNDILYNECFKLKPLLVDALEALGASLPTIQTVEVGWRPLPALVLAYRQYDDVTREKETIERNRLAYIHPGFPSTNTVEVLSD